MPQAWAFPHPCRYNPNPKASVGKERTIAGVGVRVLQEPHQTSQDKQRQLFPQLEAVYLQTAVFALAIVLPPPRPTEAVCVPARPPVRGSISGLHGACANPLALCRGSPHMESEQILLQTSGVVSSSLGGSLGGEASSSVLSTEGVPCDTPVTWLWPCSAHPPPFHIPRPRFRGGPGYHPSVLEI